MLRYPKSTLRTRATLLARICDAGDGVSWEEFHRLYRRLVYGRARSAGLGHADAEEVAQEVFARVAETISTFDPDPRRGSFRGWLMQLTRWRIADKFESHDRQPLFAPHAPTGDTTTAGTATIERQPAPGGDDDAWDVAWREEVLRLALERVARRVPPRHFQAFDLSTRQGWPAWRISIVLHLSPATVYVIRHRLMELLRAEAAAVQRSFQ